MLLDLRAEERQKFRTFSLVTGVIGAGAILVLLGVNLSKSSLGPDKVPVVEGGTIELGKLLFTQYLLPFEIVSVLLLVAMVGVVLLSKKELK
jgi:NADH-quinone oxidoreductase subunit J